MDSEIERNVIEAMTNPEAAVEEVRRAFLRGDCGATLAATKIVQIALVAFNLQRLHGAEEAQAFALGLLGRTGGDELAGMLVDWAIHASAAVTDTLRTQRAQAICSFDRCNEQAARVAAHIDAAADVWKRMLSAKPELGQDTWFALTVGVLHRLPLLARSLAAQGRAQRELMLGNRLQYIEALEEVLAILENERRTVVPLEDRIAPVIRPMLAVTADNVRAQLDFVRRSLADTDLPRLEPTGRNVFIVHGHDEAAWRALRDILEDEFRLQAVVLKEEASITRTLIQKFEAEAADCAFAIVLVTPDDLVAKGQTVTPQARPNVLFELGWFYGRLGPGRLTLLQKGEGTALPSDLKGIVTLVYTQDLDEIKSKLRKELVAAGLLADKASARRLRLASRTVAGAPAKKTAGQKG